MTRTPTPVDAAESTPFTRVSPKLLARTRPVRMEDGYVMHAAAYVAHVQTDHVRVGVPRDGAVRGRTLSVEFGPEFVAWMREVNREALAVVTGNASDVDFVYPPPGEARREKVRVRFGSGFVATQVRADGDRIAIIDYVDATEGIRHEPRRDLTLLVAFRGVLETKDRFSFVWTVVSSQKHVARPPPPADVLHSDIRVMDDSASVVGDWLRDARDHTGNAVDEEEEEEDGAREPRDFRLGMAPIEEDSDDAASVASESDRDDSDNAASEKEAAPSASSAPEKEAAPVAPVAPEKEAAPVAPDEEAVRETTGVSPGVASPGDPEGGDSASLDVFLGSGVAAEDGVARA